MRICFTSLVAAAILFSGAAIVSEATELRDTHISKQVSSGADNSIEATQISTTRFLRSHNDEERGFIPIKQLNLIMGNLEGQGVQRAYHILQTLGLTTAQREAIMKLHLARLAKQINNA
ncbi:hypothetical protein F442_07270 [Phytophthora nicotianae P10297]|uniref:RxLR effector protein n=2 Tax=Phytophthora nicotianae TaxID=4792 RepID=W2ZHM8_PHYNI|nr:hypothetical protein F444_07270 [Phytophthora nicotianae P1976]ETP46491.1 hypothetical protein F442_07270 [Phytophthora nicotianae P10297]